MSLSSKPGATAAGKLVREALVRSGRDDPALLKGCLGELRFSNGREDPRDAASSALRDQGLRIGEGDGPIEILAPGIDPALVAEIAAIDAEEEALQARIDVGRARRSKAMLDAVRKRLADEGREHSDDLDISGSHACDGSPSGRCAYDAGEDPSLDDCLFCGLPDERK